MKQVLKNPLVIGAIGGICASGFHYVNQKIVKKEKKVEVNDLLKVFVAVSVLLGGGMYVASKKNLLPSKLMNGTNNAPKVVTTAPPVQNGGSAVPGPVSNVSSAVTPATSNNLLSGNQTITNMPSPKISGLEISDINDVIHTGTPNF